MSLVKTLSSLLSSLPLIVTTIPKEIQLFNDCVDTARGRTLEHFEELLQNIHVSQNFIMCYIRGIPKIHYGIIYSWCIHFVE